MTSKEIKNLIKQKTKTYNLSEMEQNKLIHKFMSIYNAHISLRKNLIEEYKKIREELDKARTSNKVYELVREKEKILKDLKYLSLNNPLNNIEKYL